MIKNWQEQYSCAERKTGRERTFKIFEGEPLETSYGEDLYKMIFEADTNKS